MASKAPKSKTAIVRLYNCSKQMISIQAKPPGGDFYLHEQQVRLSPGKYVDLPKSYLREAQVQNLCKSRHLKVIYDSEAQE